MTMHHETDRIYRALTEAERDQLTRQGNRAEDWDDVLVADGFACEAVWHCRFAGVVRIGAVTGERIERNGLSRPTGLFNSYIEHCEFGDGVCVDSIGHLSRIVVNDGAMLLQCGEISAEDAKAELPWIAVWNENGGRAILPFPGMVSADAFLWASQRGDETFLRQLEQLTLRSLKQRSGGVCCIGKNAFVQNVQRARNMHIGEAAVISGAAYMQNITVESCAEAPARITAAIELRNGVIGEGCEISSGSSAINFALCPHSQLSMGARLTHTVLGENSHVACCEIDNSLIFPFHQQHHNNSFLIATCIQGQSNIAAGATIGSNNNSRSPDGELLARRGFWPGLCVSLKHNSRFASFTMLAKAAYPAELDIPFPFSLVSNDEAKGQLTIMPAYWPMYNMYALARNDWKYARRDKRHNRVMDFEYRFLAPDTVNEIFAAMQLLAPLIGDGANAESLEFTVRPIERSHRRVVILKPARAMAAYREMIHLYVMRTLMRHIQEDEACNLEQMRSQWGNAERGEWVNFGGQIVSESALRSLRDTIRAGQMTDWNAVHAQYAVIAEQSKEERAAHAWASLLELHPLDQAGPSIEQWNEFKDYAQALDEKWAKAVHDSRAKDFQDPFRAMAYASEEEMKSILGDWQNDPVIQ